MKPGRVVFITSFPGEKHSMHDQFTLTLVYLTAIALAIFMDPLLSLVRQIYQNANY